MSLSSSALSLGPGAFVGTQLRKEQDARACAFPQKAAPVRASAEPSAPQGASSASLKRREALLLSCTAAAGAVLLPSSSAYSISAPKGYAAREDSQDRYRFFYPFGWQEVGVKGQDVVFKDVIEPLENVAVNVINTDKKSITELGAASDVAQALVEKVLTGPTQKSKLVAAEEKETNGKVYYTFEFVAAAPSYKRHALGVVAIANGKLYTLTTGSNERRWGTMKDKLKAVVNSFEAI